MKCGACCIPLLHRGWSSGLHVCHCNSSEMQASRPPATLAVDGNSLVTTPGLLWLRIIPTPRVTVASLIHYVLWALTAMDMLLWLHWCFKHTIGKTAVSTVDQRRFLKLSSFQSSQERNCENSCHKLLLSWGWGFISTPKVIIQLSSIPDTRKIRYQTDWKPHIHCPSFPERSMCWRSGLSMNILKTVNNRDAC